jgi:predicted metalloprotease with PDZ domain
VHGTGELPLRPLLEQAGVAWVEEGADLAAELGLKLSEGPLTGVQVKSVLFGSAAQRAGVSAGDELLAVDGWRLRRLDEARAWLQPGRAFELTLVRDQRLRVLKLQPPKQPARGLQLRLTEQPSPAARALRQAWLGA